MASVLLCIVSGVNAMLYNMFERTVFAAVISLGAFFAAVASGRQKKSLVAVRRHRPEP
jgi:hypothetical protein